MAFINGIITVNGTDISQKVISMQRQTEICTGIGTLNITIEWETGNTIDILDEVILYEEGNKIGTYLVVDPGKESLGTTTFTCQDNSKKLCDYFIVDSYVVPDMSYARTWLIKILDETGISYTFTTSGNGSILNNNTTIGKQSAYEIVQTLLQMSGWYMYFNSDGTCIIGGLEKDLTNYSFSFDDTEIQDLLISKHDRMFRNRAVVWGIASESEKKWVYTDIYQPTAWDTSDKDQRAVVLSNSYIRSNAVANSLARKMLNEFSELSVEKTIKLVRFYNVTIGDIVLIESEYFSGSGLVSTVMSEFSSQAGHVTTIILDVRCPRLFGYFGGIVPVYVGTEGAGVWRKPLDSGLWENYSLGLFPDNLIDPSIPGVDINEINPTEGIIPDLIIKNSVFVCINGWMAYRNIGHTVANWKYIDPGTLEDLNGISYTSPSLQAVACDIDSTTNNLFVGYRLRDTAAIIIGEQRSWVVEYTSQGRVIHKSLLSFGEDKQNFTLLDVDKYTSAVNLAAAICPASYDSFWGNRKVFLESQPDNETTCFGIVPSGIVQSGICDAVTMGAGTYYGLQDPLVEGNTVTDFGDHALFQYVAYSGDTDYPVNADVNFFDYNFSWTGNQHTFRYTWRDINTDDYQVVDLALDQATGKRLLLHSSYTPLIYEYPTQKPDCYVATTEQVVFSGIQVVDGMSGFAGERVLVKDQDDPSENGIYVMSSFAWARALDMNTVDEVLPGTFISINNGTTNKNTCWQTDSTTISALNIDPIVFYEVLVHKEENRFFVEKPVISDGDITYTHTNIDIVGSNGSVFIIDYYSGKNSAKDGRGSGSYGYVYNIAEKEYITIDSIDKVLNFMITGNSVINAHGLTIPSKVMVAGDGIAIAWGEFDLRAMYAWYFPNYFYLQMYTTFDESVYNTLFKIKTAHISNKGEITADEEVIWRYTLPQFCNDTGTPTANGPLNFLAYENLEMQIQGYGVNETNTAYVKFRLKINEGVWRAGTCTNCRGEDKRWCVSGVVKVSNSIELSDITALYRGTVNCAPVDYIDYTIFNYNFSAAAINILHSKSEFPVYIYGGKIYDSRYFLSELCTIPLTGIVISPIMDDIDNCIYINKALEKIMYKISVTGDIIARFYYGNFYPTIYNATFMFFNGLMFFGYFGKSSVTSYQIVKIKDESILPGKRIALLLKERDQDLFTTLNSYFFPFAIENSRDHPLVGWTNSTENLISYDVPQVVISGVTISGSGFKQCTKIYNRLSSPRIITSGIADARIVDLGGSFYTDDGILDIEYERFVVTAGQGSTTDLVSTAKNTDSELTPFHTLISGDTIAYRIETSNYYASPYLFVTSSGVTISGEQSLFYQRNPYSSTWIDYSLGLPLQNLLCCRLDDRI